MKKFAGYIRVSTKEQAVQDLSLEHQLSRVREYALSMGGKLVESFIDKGETATDTNRREFKRMMAMALGDDRPFDAIVVFKTNRFARNVRDAENAVYQLTQNKVAYLSATQDLSDPMMRQLHSMQDESFSRNNSEIVQAMMAANAKEGFWNGGPAPFGFRLKVAERRGRKEKKKLVVDPVEQDIVKRIFEMSLYGDGEKGPMGVKAITEWLNQNGFLTRRGNRWTTGSTHSLLTNTLPKGEYTRTVGASAKFSSKGAGEIIHVDCPPLIEASLWDAVQAKLKRNNPKVAAPRLAAADHILSGIAQCKNCGSSMVIRTGKSGRYRYYSCQKALSQGKVACDAPVSIPADELNETVTELIMTDLCNTERLTEMLTKLSDREKARRNDSNNEHARVEAEAAICTREVGNLMSLVRSGLESIDDPTFAAAYSDAKTKAGIATEALNRIAARHRHRDQPSESQISAFTDLMRTKIRTGDNKLRRAWFNSVLSKVVVSKIDIVVFGRNSQLHETIANGGDALLSNTTEIVPSRMIEWCTRVDSNH